MLHIKKILCPTDFSEPSQEALKMAGELATAFGAELCVLHVMEPLEPALGIVSAEEWEASRSSNAAQQIYRVATECVGPDVPTRALVRSGRPAAEILSAAEEEAPGVLVISTHGLTGWRRVVFGSVAEAIVRQAPCPVLTVRAPQEK